MNDNRGVQFWTIFTDRRDRTHLFHRVNLKISTRPASAPSSTSIHRFGIDVKSRLRVNNFASVGNSGSVAIRCRLETLLGKVWFNRVVINAVNLLRFRPIVPPLRPLSPPSTAPRWPRNLESDSIAYNLRHPPIVIYSIDGIFWSKGEGRRSRRLDFFQDEERSAGRRGQIGVNLRLNRNQCPDRLNQGWD